MSSNNHEYCDCYAKSVSRGGETARADSGNGATHLAHRVGGSLEPLLAAQPWGLRRSENLNKAVAAVHDPVAEVVRPRQVPVQGHGVELR
tara:strand:+ start:16920 stop:17189 length:270 start_codon:yes stop_codon:yes gene_type:complete